MIDINNRRYIGSKYKLLSNIESCIEDVDVKKITFADVFAGTGVVAYHFAKSGARTIVNDILYSNIVIYKTFFSDENIDNEKIQKFLTHCNNLEYKKIKPNYCSDIYSKKYFSYNDAKKIGFIRDTIEENKNNFNEREYNYLISSLLFSVDRIANTVGHFESFLKKEPVDTNFTLSELNIKKIKNAKIYNIDANELVRKIKTDVVYIDPPYNARQYINFYHVLENIARWNKPTEFEGNSMKFKRDELKSDYSYSKAPKVFADLIENIDAKKIIVSYSNTYDAKSNASNNKITEEQIIDILNKKGTLKKIEIPYKSFNAGKTDLKNHKEYIFICEVK